MPASGQDQLQRLHEGGAAGRSQVASPDLTHWRTRGTDPGNERGWAYQHET